MSLLSGYVHQLKVLRKTDIGYMLTNGEEEVFLHFNESMKKELSVNDVVDAFLYFDQKGRVAATLLTPIITMDRPARLEVVSINQSLGVFMNMGVNKDLLLSKDDLPLNHDQWPHIGDQVFVKMIQKNRLTAKPINKEDLSVLKEIELKTHVEATIQKIGHSGINALTDEGIWIFVHQSMYQEDVWIGKRIDILVTHFSEKGYSGTCMKLKEDKMVDDADEILNYLIKHKTMSLDAQSSPEDIISLFDMSKKAFKRAIGILYKQRRIDFVDGKTILVEQKHGK